MHRLKSEIAAPVLPLEGVALVELPPPLKWAGGKRWLVPRLRRLIGDLDFGRLVEPFVGGLAVTLGLSPRLALLRDVNAHLVNFYSWLQKGLHITRCGVPIENDESVYYANRARFNELIQSGGAGSEEAAVLFYYLNRTAYNGLCRFNRKGLFNVPFGRYEMIGYQADFSDYKLALSNYSFETGDFEGVEIRPGDVIYADPPYDVEFTSYSADGFSWADQVRLAEWLSTQHVPVIASNQATQRIEDLYRNLGFRIATLPAPRRISCDGNREDAMEILATRDV